MRGRFTSNAAQFGHGSWSSDFGVAAGGDSRGISPDRPRSDEILRQVISFAFFGVGAICTSGLRGFWRPLCT